MEVPATKRRPTVASLKDEIEQHKVDPAAHPALLEAAHSIMLESVQVTRQTVERIEGYMVALGLNNGTGERAKVALDALNTMIDERGAELDEARAKVVLQRKRAERRKERLNRIRFYAWGPTIQKFGVYIGIVSTAGWAISSWTGHSPGQLVMDLIHLLP